MRTSQLTIVRGALLLALILLPLSVSAWGDRGDVGILTDVESESSHVWIDFERYAVDAATKIHDRMGQKTTLERLEEYAGDEVAYIVRDSGSKQTLVSLRVFELIED